MTTTNIPAPARWLFRLGWGLLLLGLVIFGVQFFALKQFMVPWYAPVLGLAGVGVMVLAGRQRWTAWRIAGLVTCAVLVALESLFLLFLGQVPTYAGPAKGQPIPSFIAVRADGRPFTQRDLVGQPTVLLFFRGHW